LGKKIPGERVTNRLIELSEVKHHGDHQRFAVTLNFQHVAAKYTVAEIRSRIEGAEAPARQNASAGTTYPGNW